MKIHRRTITRDTRPDTDIHDISTDVLSTVRESGISEGTVVISVPGSTASITTIEYESGAVADLEDAIARIAPRDLDYAHDARWGDGNGYAHVRAALMGPSLSLPVIEGEVATGTWQQVVLCDFDNVPRQRRIHIQVAGL